MEAGTKITLSTATENADIYYEIVTGDAASTLTKENATTLTKYTEAFDVVEGTVYAIAVKDSRTSEITSAVYTIEVVPEDSIRMWNAEAPAAEYKIYDIKDLNFLAATVSAGNSLAGITVTLANDITINEKVLKDGFIEPDEGEGATANAALVNLASIGMRDKGFAGTFDGNGKVIKGLYIYQGHQGLGFIGSTAEGAVIKNVTIIDACVVNCNATADDGGDDDRFGGLVGMTQGATTIENCVFIGVVGSSAAAGRGKTEYVGGLVGRVDAATTAKDCTVLARVYAELAYDIINNKGADKLTLDNVIGLDAAATPIVYEGDNEYVIAAVDAINNPPVKISAMKVNCTYKKADRYQFVIDGFEVKENDALKVLLTYPEAAVTGPLLRASVTNTKFQPTTAVDADYGFVELTATATEETSGLMITLNGTFNIEEPILPLYIAQISINDVDVALDTVTSPSGSYFADLEIEEIIVK